MVRPVMSRVLSRLRGLRQYASLKGKIAVANTFGESNGGSDNTSRDMFQEPQAYCTQTGVKSRQVNITQDALQFVHDFLEEIRADCALPCRGA